MFIRLDFGVSHHDRAGIDVSRGVHMRQHGDISSSGAIRIGMTFKLIFWSVQKQHGSYRITHCQRGRDCRLLPPKGVQRKLIIHLGKA